MIKESLSTFFTASLKKYHEVNGVLPERIIVYRDGVGDGQLGAVSQHEVPQLLSTFKDFGAEYR